MPLWRSSPSVDPRVSVPVAIVHHLYFNMQGTKDLQEYLLI